MEIASGLESNSTLTALDLSGNGIGSESGAAFGAALHHNRKLRSLRLASNKIEGGPDFAESLCCHPELLLVDLSHNEIQCLPISCQLKLGRRENLSVDLSDNPLSSPPLGRRATPEERATQYYLLSPNDHFAM